MQLTESQTTPHPLRLERATVAWKDRMQEFQQTPGSRDFSRQYYHLYGARLQAVRERLTSRAVSKWGSSVPVLSVHELQEGGDDCVLIGTMFKQQKLKPSILKEISDEHNLEPQPILERFVAEDDSLVLEDEMARVRLEGEVDAQTYVTGVVCAVLGSEQHLGRFTVRDICFAEPRAPSVERPLLESDAHLLLLSGLGLQSDTDLLPAQLLVDLITGQLGCADQQRAMSTVARVIIAGNSLSSSSRDAEFLKRAAYIVTDVAGQSAEAMRSLDALLTPLAAGCQLDLMPGEHDPSNHLLPQRPLHRCLLPQAARYGSFRATTNPYQAEVGGRLVLGTSGQNVHELSRYSELGDALTGLERLLSWGHLCPTAPDTLSCYPYSDRDPFVIDTCPDILFAGNQPEFATKLVAAAGRPVRLLCLPAFCQTPVCALVNLRTLDVTRLSMGVHLSSHQTDSPQPDK